METPNNPPAEETPPAPTPPATPSALSKVDAEVKAALGVDPVSAPVVPWKAPFPSTPAKQKETDPDPKPVMVLALFTKDVTLNGVSYLRGNEYIISAEVAHGIAGALAAPAEE